MARSKLRWASANSRRDGRRCARSARVRARFVRPPRVELVGDALVVVGLEQLRSCSLSAVRPLLQRSRPPRSFRPSVGLPLDQVAELLVSLGGHADAGVVALEQLLDAIGASSRRSSRRYRRPRGYARTSAGSRTRRRTPSL